MHRAVFGAFLLSGFAGLVHQVVWAKLLAHLIGTTAHAQAAVLAVFMGGLALGSVLFGRRADARGRPLRTYVILEIAIGVYGLVLPLLLSAAAVGYAAAATRLFSSPTLTFALRFTLAFSLVVLPAVLMGGTLPILVRHLVERVDQTRRQVGNLYALNSLGAVLGAGTAGFLLLPLLGIYPSLAVASLLNLAAAALVRTPARLEQASEGAGEGGRREATRGAEPGATPYRSDQYAVTLVALAATGFAAMGYEVLFSRVIALAFGGSAYSFTVMLMAFISGITLGSAIVSRIRVERPLWWLGCSQLVVVVALLAVTPLVARLPYLIGLLRIGLREIPAGFELYQLGKAGLCLLVLLLPTTCLGLSFPLVAQVQARSQSEIGRRVGSTYAWNTAGNVLGAVLTSLVLLPRLGLLGAFHLNVALNLAAGVALLLVATEVATPRRLLAAAATAVVIGVYAVAGGGWLDPLNLSRNHLRMLRGPDPGGSPEERARHPAASFEAWKESYVAKPTAGEGFHFEEDAHNTVLVYDDGTQTTLYVNGKPDASTRRDLSTQVLLGQIPMFLHLDARSLLVIGYGSGITAGSALRHPLERLDIVEISPGVLDGDPLFSDFNYGVLSDPRIRVTIDDGVSFLRASPDRYDVIISEPSNPWVAGIAGLFTVEYFEALRAKLEPGGVAVVWFHQYEQSADGVMLVLRTLGSVFPEIVLFRATGFADLIAVASLEPIELDPAAMELRFDEAPVRNDLARIGISNVASLLAQHAVSNERLRRGLTPGPLNTVNHNRLEYMSPRSFFWDERATFLQQHDPLYRGEAPGTDAFLDRYVEYRVSEGEPVRAEELAYRLRHEPRPLARALAERTRASTRPPSRPSRGQVLDPSQMGLFEAGHWARFYAEDDRMSEALPFLRRYEALLPPRARAKRERPREGG
jgi:spermidine synthase